MNFTINGHVWTIVEMSAQEMQKTFVEYMGEPALYVFGLTKYPIQCIFINNELVRDQKIRTLKHELTHCYIWETGLYNAPNYNDEMVCDIVASSNEFINSVVYEYFKGNKT